MDAASSSSAFKQILRAKREVQESLADARTLQSQWLAAGGSNDMTRREVDNLGKLFKNKLLTAKWDCEDLDELLNAGDCDLRSIDQAELADSRQFVDQCRGEVASMIGQLDDHDTRAKSLSKHGINLAASQQGKTTSSTSHALDASSSYSRLINTDAEEIQFDKSQLQSATNSRARASVYSNALYDHLESQQTRKVLNTSQVFSNVGRPEANVYMNSNENEIILDMLETEFYDPPSELKNQARSGHILRKLLETDRNKILGTIAFLFSFPILLVLFLVA